MRSWCVHVVACPRSDRPEDTRGPDLNWEHGLARSDPYRKDLGACRACQGRESGERSERTLDTSKRSRTIRTERRTPTAPISRKIESRRRPWSTQSDSRRPAGESASAPGTASAPRACLARPAAFPCCAMNAKSFKVPSRLRFLVRPNAISDIRDAFVGNVCRHDADSSQPSHTASGNTAFNRFNSRDRNDHRKSRPFADEEQVLTTTDSEDVAVPVAEPRRGLDDGQVVGLFQAASSFCVQRRTTIGCAYGTTLRARMIITTLAARAGPRSRRGLGHASGHDLSTHPGRNLPDN